MRFLALALLALTASTAGAAPDGFRKSDPLTKRAVTLAWNQKLTVHCATTDAIYRSTGGDDAPDYSEAGRIRMDTLEIELPPKTCAPMEAWLKGKRVSLSRLGEALFTLGHEVGHSKFPGGGEETDADCYSTRKFNTLAKLFGVKSAATLRQLRIAAALSDFC